MATGLLERLKGDLAAYRPIPFWSWNDALKPERLRRQIDEMAASGMGGFFMHARGGLETEYMGEDWMLPHKELVVDSLSNIDINEMRKMLVELKKHNYVTVVHSRVRETTALNKLCCELGIRTELLYLNNHGEAV